VFVTSLEQIMEALRGEAKVISSDALAATAAYVRSAAFFRRPRFTCPYTKRFVYEEPEPRRAAAAAGWELSQRTTADVRAATEVHVEVTVEQPSTSEPQTDNNSAGVDTAIFSTLCVVCVVVVLIVCYLA
jgi:hypothetical protein